MAKHYSVYNRRTDMPLIIHGTAAQCAEFLGITIKSFYSIVMRQRKGQEAKKIEVFIDERGDDDEMGDC